MPIIADTLRRMPHTAAAITVRRNDTDTHYPASLKIYVHDFIHFSFLEIVERKAAKRNTPG
jgi:hypothetical protein